MRKDGCMSTLRQLAEIYGCDKLFAHSYVESFYSELFANRKVEALLEIGIGYEELMKPFVPHYCHGASLKMWRDLFPGALIFGADIRRDSLIWEPPIRCIEIDQSNPADLKRLADLTDTIGKWDVVIDDGSHQTDHQILTAQVLLPSVAPGGVYIVEDVQEPERVAAALPGSVIHRFDKRPDDVLVVKEVS